MYNMIQIHSGETSRPRPRSLTSCIEARFQELMRGRLVVSLGDCEQSNYTIICSFLTDCFERASLQWLSSRRANDS